MNRPATWKVVTIGAALTGLGVVGAGAANASPDAAPAPASVTVQAPLPAFDLPHFDIHIDRPDFRPVAWEDTSWDDFYWEDTSWDD